MKFTTALFGFLLSLPSSQAEASDDSSGDDYYGDDYYYEEETPAHVPAPVPTMPHPYPGYNYPPAPSPPAPSPPTTPGTIVDVASSVDSLSTLVDAVVAAGFAGILSAPGPYTVFAPTNDAFDYVASAYPVLFEALLTEPWIAHLQNLLAFHVVAGKAIFSSQIPATVTLQALNGEFLYITNWYGHIYIYPAVTGGTATVIAPDNAASNG